MSWTRLSNRCVNSSMSFFSPVTSPWNSMAPMAAGWMNRMPCLLYAVVPLSLDCIGNSRSLLSSFMLVTQTRPSKIPHPWPYHTCRDSLRSWRRQGCTFSLPCPTGSSLPLLFSMVMADRLYPPDHHPNSTLPLPVIPLWAGAPQSLTREYHLIPMAHRRSWLPYWIPPLVLIA